METFINIECDSLIIQPVLSTPSHLVSPLAATVHLNGGVETWRTSIIRQFEVESWEKGAKDVRLLLACLAWKVATFVETLMATFTHAFSTIIRMLPSLFSLLDYAYHSQWRMTLRLYVCFLILMWSIDGRVNGWKWYGCAILVRAGKFYLAGTNISVFGL